MREWRRPAVSVLGVLLAGIWLAGCAPAAGSGASRPAGAPPAAQPGGTSAVAPAAAGAPVKLRVGTVSPLFFQAPDYLALEKGFYREQGLEVEFVHHDTDPVALKGFLAGDTAMLYSNTGGMLLGIESGADLLIVGSSARRLYQVMTVRGDVNRLADLYGRSVGHDGPGGLLYTVMRAAFDADGADFDRVESLTIGGTPSLYQALTAGKIDGAVHSVDFADRVAADPNLKILWVAAERLPLYPGVAYGVGGKLLREQPTVVERFLAGSIRGIRYGLEHRDELLANENKRTGRDLADLANVYTWMTQVWDPDGTITADQLMYLQNLNVKLGQQRAVLPIERVADLSVQQRVVAQLGPKR